MVHKLPKLHLNNNGHCEAKTILPISLNRRPVKRLYIGTSYFNRFFSNSRNIRMVQWRGCRSTHHRPQIAAVRFPGTTEGFLSTGPGLESY